MQLLYALAMPKWYHFCLLETILNKYPINEHEEKAMSKPYTTIPKIIVVASGNSVLDNKYGHYIDQFRHVLRFMGFEKAVGKEDYIGKKIDTYLFNLSNEATQTFEQHCINDTIPCNRLLIHGSFSVPEREQRVAQALIGKSVAVDKIKFTDINRVRNALLLDRIYPSSGVMVIDYFLKQYDTVCVHGFDKLAYGNTNDGSLTKHFFENHNYAPDINYVKARHDYDREAIYLSALEYCGKVVQLKTLVENGCFD